MKESFKIGMQIIQELYRNIEKHKLELKGYKRNADDEKKRSTTLKAYSSSDDDKDELDEFETKDNRDKIALLSKKLQNILREKKSKEKRKTFPQKKKSNINE